MVWRYKCFYQQVSEIAAIIYNIYSFMKQLKKQTCIKKIFIKTCMLV